jgi:hypothetical protein
MDVSQLFLQRYDALYNFWLNVVWSDVSEDQMRQRPDPRLNSIAWNLWHLTRVEDAGLNRFVVDRPQVLDDGGWLDRLNVPWRHHGTDMTKPEVDELSQRLDLKAMHGYADAVQARTREIIGDLGQVDLDAVMDEERLRLILFDEGLAHSNPAGLLQNYLGWSRGKCLMNFGLTHGFQHVGEIDVIASLVGLEF